MRKLLLCCLLPSGTSLCLSPPHHPSICTKGHFPDSVINPAAFAGVFVLCWKKTKKIIVQVMTEVMAASPGLGGDHSRFSAWDPVRCRAEGVITSGLRCWAAEMVSGCTCSSWAPGQLGRRTVPTASLRDKGVGHQSLSCCGRMTCFLLQGPPS